MNAYIEKLQDAICHELEALDVVRMKEDIWTRAEGGGGRTRVIEGGRVFEKGGVNISSVHGEMPDDLVRVMNTKKGQFAACGLSLVIHPASPRVPTVHMNVRYFEMEHGDSWFGGGIDLTPYYPYPEDFRQFHLTLREACEKVIPGSYADFKSECDSYFTIRHRGEMRGIGGIFFDYLKKNNPLYFKLVRSVGDAFLPSFVPIVKKRKDENYSEKDKLFQLIRRGRYIEFNLVYDRGTVFGLQTNGRTESILMSMPPEARFFYDWQPEPDSPYAEMRQYYHPQVWI